MKLPTEPYAAQARRWPARGRHVLAAYDDQRVVVYQAYRPEIGRFAAERGYFGGPFSLSRMSWVKPNFLWMMHRSGWGSKEGQKVVLAVSLRRDAFDEILAAAVHSSFDPAVYPSREVWQTAVKSSEVRLQWDPDHDPGGAKLERRAIQLGLRGETLARYAREWIVDIEDVSPFVRVQREHIGDRESLLTPVERVYPVADAEVRARLGIA